MVFWQSTPWSHCMQLVVVARHEGKVKDATRAARGADGAAAAGSGPTCTRTYHRALCEKKQLHRTLSHLQERKFPVRG
jgi:hypothetical protein